MLVHSLSIHHGVPGTTSYPRGSTTCNSSTCDLEGDNLKIQKQTDVGGWPWRFHVVTF